MAMIATCMVGKFFSQSTSFDHVYETRTACLSKPDRIDHEWEMKVKKTFLSETKKVLCAGAS